MHPTPKELKHQHYRIAGAKLVVVNATVQSVVQLLFACVGTLGWGLAFTFASLSLGTTVMYLVIMQTGLNLRFRDPNLLAAQLLTSGALQMLYLMLAPQLAVLFLLVTVVLFGYAAVQFTPRQFTYGWLLYGAASAAAIWAVRDRFGYPGGSSAETVLVWLFFFITVRRLALASAQFSSLREKLSDKNRQLEASLQRIEELASHDDLTGAYNRRSFMARLEEELQRGQRSGASCCLAVLDLDHFKSINDQHGHPVGDAVLKTVCEIVQGSLRGTDRLGRIGGEEFGVVLAQTHRGEAEIVLERLRLRVAAYHWSAVSPGLQVSFSAGLAAWRAGDTSGSIVQRADQALYRAKHQGRNQVVVDSAPDAQAL